MTTRLPRDWIQISITALPGLAAVIALIFTSLSIRATNAQLQLAEQGQITDRYNAAVTNLGSPSVDVRLGGIYALQRIMQDSPRDQPTIVAVLCAFVRDHANAATVKSTHLSVFPHTSTAPSQLPTDIQAAITVVGTRNTGHDGSTTNVDLANVDLSGMKLFAEPLSGANLTGADLSGADLTGADLSGADLIGAKLFSADLADANLSGADLFGDSLTGVRFSNADLSYANLSHANLGGMNFFFVKVSHADLSFAELPRANLADANLSYTNLSHADLTGANLTLANLSHANLTGADLTGAKLSDANLTGAKGLRTTHPRSP